ncbi:unnamed protein product [Rotaria magnacalcarata]|uniref:Uncharacterized protein n=1 Tax=Rotaria magnacalcarata TaxID=392030 RepID=A0A8S2Q3R6_9BILA|nr:unnamed protein product [Rotaria magnacalcarata]
MERPDLSGILFISIAASANVGETVNSIFSGESQSKTCPQGGFEESKKKRHALRHRSRRQRVESFLHGEIDSTIVSYGYLASSTAAYPDEMKLLLQAADVDGRNFREHVLNYNSALAFASLAAQIAAPTTREPYCFRIHEQIYHRISALHPGENQRAQYGQLYILDSTLALQERMGNVGSYRCNENIMKMLGNVMTRISPFTAAFKMMHEVEQEEIRRSKREKRAPASIRMIFDNNCRMRDQRRYNLPRANQVTAVFIGGQWRGSEISSCHCSATGSKHTNDFYLACRLRFNGVLNFISS